MGHDFSETISAKFGIFGLPFTQKNAKLHILPVPWEATTSYGKGASLGPELIRNASEQIDLFDIDTGTVYEQGYYMFPVSKKISTLNKVTKLKAQKVIKLRTSQSKDKKLIQKLTQEVNSSCEKMSDWVYKESCNILKSGKLFALVGGDHSTPLGAIKAISEKHNGNFGILHIDAHADLRVAYQGFKQSHASIMYNVMSSDFKPQKLVQLGIRDFCEEEYELTQSRSDIKTFFDSEIKEKLLNGESWKSLCKEIINELPANVYISFDIDGLDPIYCPHTGTPVPGGLNIDQVFYLFKQIYESGRKLVGFDLNEVSSGGLRPDQAEWDGNVGARVLYKLCGWLVKSNKTAPLNCG